LASYKDYTEMHGQQNLKVYNLQFFVTDLYVEKLYILHNRN